MLITNKQKIENFLRIDTPLFIYHIGDLDDFYWKYTTWFAAEEDPINAILLLYTAVDPPVLLALSPESNLIHLIELSTQSIQLLPDKFYSHLSPGIEDVLKPYCNLEAQGNYQKMNLVNKSKINSYNITDAVNLGQEDQNEIRILYQESYPENSFDSRMLETGMFFGLRENKKLVSIAGVHVYSERYRVAALGNITTHPDFRNRGYGKLVTAALCRSLLERVNAIGLNVNRNNQAAIKCYEDLGFKFTAPYLEYMVEKK